MDRTLINKGKGKGKGPSQYPAQGKVRVGGFLFPGRGRHTIPDTLKEGVKEGYAQSKIPHVIPAPNRGSTPNLTFYMQMFYSLSHKCD